MDRRNFLAGIIAASVAPAFIKTAGLLMPIKPLIIEPAFLFPESQWQYVKQEIQGKIYTATFAIDSELPVIVPKGMVRIA